jgi:hypothetical protein
MQCENGGASAQGDAASAPAPTPAPKPKKKRGCLIAVLVVLLGCAAVVLAGYFFVAKAGEPRDLGVTYTEQDYQSALAKSGIALDSQPDAGQWDGTEMVYSGTQEIDATFSQAEISAALSFEHSPNFPVRSVQVRLLGGNRAEASGLVSYGGREWPVYVIGSVDVVGGNRAGGNAEAAKVMGIDVPEQYLDMGEAYLLGLVNERLEAMTGLDIRTLEVEGDQIHVVGTIPAQATRADSE